MDADLCYRAVASRDARFSGRFFVAVTTTGVYCRPGCPARLPRRDSCRFYPCAAAAEEAGFRACRRCRPDTAPGSPAWLGTSATVSRALRLIEDGALDHGSGVGELAGRVGVGERHLRRLFDEHLGASPLSVATTRRVHFARRLVDETSMGISEIAFAAGFSSLRRFNAAFRATFQRSPREVRARDVSARAGAPELGSATLSLRLPVRAPFGAASLAAFLAPRAIPGVERWDGLRYSRTVSLGGRAGVLTAELAPDAIRLTIPAALGAHALDAVTRVSRLFDAQADPREVAAVLGADPALAPLVAASPGVRVPGCFDRFETAARVLLGQQVSVAGATTLAGRLVHRHGVQAFGPGDASRGRGGVQALGTGDASGHELTHLFPTPDAVADGALDALGVPGARADALRSLARAVRDGSLDLSAALPLEEAERQLRAIRGIGPWSAHVIAMRVFSHPDAFPADDLVLRKRLGLSSRELTRRAEAWRPFRAYAALLLWTSPRAERSS